MATPNSPTTGHTLRNWLSDFLPVGGRKAPDHKDNGTVVPITAAKTAPESRVPPEVVISPVRGVTSREVSAR